MHKAYLIGVREKHRFDFRFNWFTGLCTIAIDGHVVSRQPFMFKIAQSFEIGNEEKHLVAVTFNFFDYFRDTFHVTVDGQRPAPDAELHDSVGHSEDNAIDDAASALTFVASVNLLFSVIGTLFVPDLDALHDRLMMLLAGMIYLFLALKSSMRERGALIFGTIVFVLDSVFRLMNVFSFGGLLVRGIILYYLVVGIWESRLENRTGRLTT